MATTLKNVQAAEKEAKGVESSLGTLDSIALPPLDVEVQPKEPKAYNVLFKLVKKRKGRYWMDNCCDAVPNPKNNNIPERIWLLSGARSIWDSDLEYILKDKNRYDRARRGMDIVFLDGVCMVRSTDTLRLEFMRKHTKNIGKRRTGTVPGDFYEYNADEEQKDRMQKQLIKIELIGKAKDMDIKEVKKLAAFLGIGFYDEVGLPKSDDGLRTELMLRADSDPSTFQRHLGSKEVDVSWMVRTALVDAKIDAGHADGRIFWAHGKGIICKMPSGRKPLEYLTELALTNSEEGRQFKEQLEKIVT